MGGHEELAGDAGDLLLAIAEIEAGQIARVLAPDAEIRIDAFARHPLTQRVEPKRPRASVVLDPALQIRVAWNSGLREREHRGDLFRRQLPAWHLAMFFSCCASEVAN